MFETIGGVFETIDWEAFGSVGAMMVALVALGAAILESRATRKHNRLSVRPLLRIDCLENEGFTLHNTGAGPAIFREFQVFADEEPIECGEDDAPAILAAEAVGLDRLLPDPDPGGHHFFAYTPGIGDALMAQEHFDLLRINKLPNDRHERSAAYAALLRITFRVRYATVYHEEQTYE